MRDVTETAPTRRMSVVRGTLHRGASGAVAEAVTAAAAQAAMLAAKRAPDLLPALHAAAPTHVQVDFAVEDGVVHATATVQAYARHDLDDIALVAVATALVELRRGLADKDARIGDVHVVQNVG